jgi:Leucine-rich repeat (LRR) protein
MHVPLFVKVYGVPGLSVLDLSENQLSTLQPDAWSAAASASTLQTLLLDCNAFTAVPVAALSALPALSTLGMRLNAVNAVPMEVGNLKSLQSIGKEQDG